MNVRDLYRCATLRDRRCPPFYRRLARHASLPLLNSFLMAHIRLVSRSVS